MRRFPGTVAAVAALIVLAGSPAVYANTTFHVSASTGVDGPSCGAQTSPCATIGQAVMNASAGDAVVVEAGTYNESVIVDKSLTLDGAQAGNPGTAARASAPAAESLVTGGNIAIEASDVTVDGFSFGRAGNQVCVACFAFETQSRVTIANNVFTGYEPDSFGPWQVTGPVGVNHTTNTVITGNYFSSADADLGDFGGAVVQWFDGGCSGAVVSNNIFVAADASALSDIYFWCDSEAGEATATISVSGNHDTAMGSSDFALFTHITGGAEVDVTGNRIAMTSVSSSGIFFSTDPGLATVKISGNTLNGSPFRAVKLTTNARVPGQVSITGNDFSGNGVGVYISPNGLSGGTVVLRGNNLSGETGDSAGDGPDGVYNDLSSGGIVDAIDNWWGCNGGPGAPGCSAAVGLLSYNPWLVLGVSANPSSVTIGDSSTVTADVTHDSAGSDTSASGTIPDGTTIAFATDFGTLSANSAGTTLGTASVTIGSSTPGTAHVSAALDAQSVSTTVTFTTPPVPTSTDQCKKGGWQSYGNFKNQGDCVSFVATRGKNAPAR